MSKIIVTTYFEFDSEKNDFYLEHFKKMIPLGFEIILFLDCKLEKMKQELEQYNIKIVIIHWDDLPINRFITDNNLEIKIPGSNPKDNLKFHILMNTKIYFLKLAKDIVTKDIYIWFDFGGFKLTKDIESFQYNISKLKKTNQVIIPGGFKPCIFLDDLLCSRLVYWRFLGTILICPEHLVEKLNIENDKIINRMLLNNAITWEINNWCNIEYNNEGLIRYFKGDHNKDLWTFFNIKKFLVISFKFLIHILNLNVILNF
jgi:hypothetical protein